MNILTYLATHAINNIHTVPQNRKHETHQNVENLEIFKQNLNDKVVKEQTQIKKKNDNTLQILDLNMWTRTHD